MLKIRPSSSKDNQSIGRLIADTYAQFNLSELTVKQRNEMMGPFLHAYSADPAHRDAIVKAIKAPTVLVAELDGKIVGVLRGGRVDSLGRIVVQSLFVSGKVHRKGIGRKLMKHFERKYIKDGVVVFKLLSTLHAVPFYLAMGYRRSTGVRYIRSFDGAGLPAQPMKKTVSG